MQCGTVWKTQEGGRGFCGEQDSPGRPASPERSSENLIGGHGDSRQFAFNLSGGGPLGLYSLVFEASPSS